MDFHSSFDGGGTGDGVKGDETTRTEDRVTSGVAVAGDIVDGAAEGASVVGAGVHALSSSKLQVPSD